jgi:hypothetical protein
MSAVLQCTHDLPERETACADGMCPYCSAADVRRLRDALLAIDALATLKTKGAIGKAQKIARQALEAK